MLIIAALVALLASQSSVSTEPITKHEPLAIEVQAKEPRKEAVKLESN